MGSTPAARWFGARAFFLRACLCFCFFCLAAPGAAAFDFKFDGRLRLDGRNIPAAPRGSDAFDGAAEWRMGGHGSLAAGGDWKLSYEALWDARYAQGASEQAGFTDAVMTDFFRGWVRYDKDKWSLRGGRQEILFGSGALFRPLGFFDTRMISGVLPLTRGVDGVRSSYFIDGTTSWHGWIVPAKREDRVIAGTRWQGLLGGLDTGFVAQYHPASGLDTTPNFNLNLYQLGYHFKGEKKVGFWSEGRFDIEEKTGGQATRFDAVAGVDYTFRVGGGLHALFEYFISKRDKDFFPPDPQGDATLHQLGFLLDQPIGIATVWRLFTFYDILDGTFQWSPQIEYAITDQTYIYLQGNVGGGMKGGNPQGRFYRSAATLTGFESSIGLTLVVYFP